MDKTTTYTKYLWMVLAVLLAAMLINNCFIAQYGHLIHFYGSRFSSAMALLFHAAVCGWFVLQFLYNKESVGEKLSPVGIIAGVAAGGFGVILNFIELIITPLFITSLLQWVMVIPLYAVAFASIGLACSSNRKLQLVAFAAAVAPIIGVLIARLVSYFILPDYDGEGFYSLDYSKAMFFDYKPTEIQELWKESQENSIHRFNMKIALVPESYYPLTQINAFVYTILSFGVPAYLFRRMSKSQQK